MSMNPAQPNVRFVYTTREKYNTISNKQDGTLYYLYDEKVVMLNGEQYGITSNELINKIDSEITSKVIDFKGVEDGFASLDGDGKVPESQLPSITITLDDVEGLALALSNIGIDITTLEGRVDQTETDINTLEGRVDQTETDINTLEGRVDQTETDINTLEGRVEQTEIGIENLDSKIDSKIEGLNLNNIEGTLSVSKGGTGQTSFTLDEVLIGNNENPIKTVPTAPIYAWAMEPDLDPDNVPELPIDKIAGLDIRLQEIEGIAETNVQSDWAETDTTADSYIQNKPEEINLADIVDDIPYIQNLASNVSENATNINTHTNQINALNVELGTLGGSLSSLDTRVESNEDNISTINGEIANINNILPDKSDKGHKHKSSDITDVVNISVVPLTTLGGNLEINRITNLQTELDKTIEDIKVNGTSLPKTDKSVSITIPSPPTLENIEGTLPVSKGGTGRPTLIKDRVLVGNNEDEVKLVEQINLSQIPIPKTQIPGLQDELDSLASDITANTGNITDLAARVGTNEDDIDSLQSGLSTAQGSISTLDGKVTTNTSNILSLTTRVETNEDNIDEIQDKLNNQINIDEVPVIEGMLEDIEGMLEDNYFKGVQLDGKTFEITFTKRDGTTAVIDLPLESVVVGGSYDTENKKIILTLKNLETIEFSVADLVTGLVSIPDSDKGEASNKTLGTTSTFKVLHISTSGTITERTMTLNITANDVLGVTLAADKVLVGAGSNQVKLVDQTPISAWAMKSTLDPTDVPSIPISRVTNLQTQLNSKQDSIGYTPEDVDNKKTSWSDTVNHTNYPSEKLVKVSLDSKVDKEANKGLSTHDFTTELKNRLTGIEPNAQVNKIESISLGSEELTISDKGVSIPTTQISAWAMQPTLVEAAVPKLPISKITGLQDELDGKAPLSHEHTIANVTGLQGALDGKAATGHSHTIANVTGLQSALNNKADTGHSHTISNITGLQDELDTKQATLVNETNIKSFNSQALLGSGAFTIATNKVLGRTSTNTGPVEQIGLININSLGFAKADDIPTIPDITLNPTGTAGVITNITVDETNKHKLNITRLSRSGIDSRTIFPTNWANVGNKPTTLTGYGITLSGDVSDTNNAITISNSAITTAKIANNAVTNDKIQNSTIELDKLANIDRQTVLGNATSSTGAVTTIPLINIDGLLSSYATTTALASGLDGKADKTHNHTTANITALTGLSTTDIAGSIAAADSLNTALRKLQTQINSKTSNTGTVTSVTLSGGTGISITNPTIATTGTITVALSSMNANTIKGRISSNGAPQNLTAAEVRTILNVADGAQKNVQSDWNATSGDAFIQNKPTTFTPSSHGHTWSEITGKPTTFTPSSHTHNYTNITGLETGKVLGRTSSGTGEVEALGTVNINQIKVSDLDDGGSYALKTDIPTAVTNIATQRLLGRYSTGTGNVQPITLGNNLTLSTGGVLSATNTVYTHPNSGVTAGTYKSVTVNSQGHVTAGTNPTTLTGYGIGLTGDVTNSGNAITIGPKKVTLSKIQDIETGTVLGRTSSGTGDVEELDLIDIGDITPSNWTEVWSGAVNLNSYRNSWYTATVPSNTYIGKRIAIEVQFGTGTSYTSKIIFGVLGSGAATGANPSISRGIGWSYFDGVYLRVKTLYVYSTHSSAMHVGHLKTLFGKFTGTTIEWSTSYSETLYMKKIWVIN